MDELKKILEELLKNSSKDFYDYYLNRSAFDKQEKLKRERMEAEKKEKQEFWNGSKDLWSYEPEDRFSIPDPEDEPPKEEKSANEKIKDMLDLISDDLDAVYCEVDKLTDERRKKSKWIPAPNDKSTIVCNWCLCGDGFKTYYKYCPFCGARMENGDNLSKRF